MQAANCEKPGVKQMQQPSVRCDSSNKHLIRIQSQDGILSLTGHERFLKDGSQSIIYLSSHSTMRDLWN